MNLTALFDYEHLFYDYFQFISNLIDEHELRDITTGLVVIVCGTWKL
jgi:hypothetical protein